MGRSFAVAWRGWRIGGHAASEFSLWPIMWYNEASENAAILPYFLFDKRIIC